MGGSVHPLKLMARRSTPRCRGQATVPDTDEMGVTAKFRGQTFRVARFCLRATAGVKDLGEVDWNPASGRLDESPVLPPLAQDICGRGDAIEEVWGGGRSAAGSGSVGDVVRGNRARRGPSPLSSVQVSPSSPWLVPVPSASLSVQFHPSITTLLARWPRWMSSGIMRIWNMMSWLDCVVNVVLRGRIPWRR